MGVGGWGANDFRLCKHGAISYLTCSMTKGMFVMCRFLPHAVTYGMSVSNFGIDKITFVIPF